MPRPDQHRHQSALRHVPAEQGQAEEQAPQPTSAEDRKAAAALSSLDARGEDESAPGPEWEILGDPAHKILNANLFRVDEMLALYAAITAPVLAVEAADDSMSKWWKGRYALAEYHERLESVPDVRIEQVADAGHMLHHDQPAKIAALIEEFLA